MITFLFVACKGEPVRYKDPDDKIKNAIAQNNINIRYGYETNELKGTKSLSEKIVFNTDGSQAEYESYFGGKVFSKISFSYNENGFPIEKIYHRTDNNDKQIVKYSYNEKGLKTEYVIYDSLQRIISSHAISRKGRVETTQDFDALGKATGIRETEYDKNERPVKMGDRTFGYTLDQNGLPKEYFSLDAGTGVYVRNMVEYKNMLPIKKLVIHNDTTRIQIEYEYQTFDGKKPELK